MNNYHVFEYLYRDANNFKAFGQLLLVGKISEGYVDELRGSLDSGEFFVAEQVNVPTLYFHLWKYSDGPTLADHTFHEFASLRVAVDEEISSLPLWGETSQLLEGFKVASQESWDCFLSVHCDVVTEEQTWKQR